MSKALAGLIAVGMITGIWMLWPTEDSVSPTTAVIEAVEVSTTSTVVRTTSTTAALAADAATTTSTLHGVQTVEEAEEILRELWFGWFEGIHNQDEDRIREVVATEELVDAAKAAAGASFVSAPKMEGVVLRSTEILRAEDDCLATWGTVDVSLFRGPQAFSENVVVMRLVDDHWRILSTWTYREDVWEPECDSSLP